MVRCLLVGLVALALAGSATAAAPEGFYSSYALAKRAVKVSGEPTTRVYCAKSSEVWRALIAPYNRTDIAGLTSIETREIKLAPSICTPLLRHLRGQRVAAKALAWPLFLLAHEAAHAKGIRGEWQADCFAWKHLARTARLFGITSRAKQREVSRAMTGRGFCGR